MVRVTKLELHRTITDIMKKGDLDHLTTKKIRLLCEQKYSVDLSSRKQEIDNIVMAFINKHCCKEKKPKVEEDAVSSSSVDSESSCSSKSCSGSECSYSSEGDAKNQQTNAATDSPNQQQRPKLSPTKVKNVPVKKSAAAKKQKVAISKNTKAAGPVDVPKESPAKRAISEVDDAAYARQLQAEEWNFRQRTVKKLFRNIPQKKSDKNEQTKRKKATPFLKKCLLSPALAEVLGTDEMSRPDVVQKMWSVIRERNLFDESNKQYAICDEQLFKIFGKKRIRVIGMMKHLKNHIKDIR